MTSYLLSIVTIWLGSTVLKIQAKCDFHNTKCPLVAILKIEYAQSGSHFERIFRDDSFEIGLAEEGLSVQKILKEM